MAMVKGLLDKFIATTDGRPGISTPAEYWLLTVRVDGSDYCGRTGSPIVLAVLETALRTRRTWEIELDLSDASAPVTPTIERVRVVDDRSKICTGGDIIDLPNGERVRPLTPTALQTKTRSNGVSSSTSRAPVNATSTRAPALMHTPPFKAPGSTTAPSL